MFGQVTTITKLGAASIKLKWAITLYLDGEYIPAITLAGASEDIVRNCIDVETSDSQMMTYLQEELGFSSMEARQDIVGVRNWLKHWDRSPPNNRERDESDATINLKKEALTATLKAAINFLYLETDERKEVESYIEKIAPAVKEYLAEHD